MELPPGEYVIMVDPIWNETVENDVRYKDVMIDLYSKEELEIKPLSDAYGMEVFAKALKHAAMTRIPEENHVKYLADNPDYEDVIRIKSLDALECWYGFIYTLNNSSYRLRETMIPKLEGLEVSWPLDVGPDGEI